MSLSVVILAAGQGKRMKSDLPKVLQPLAGKPLLGHVLDTARALQAAASMNPSFPPSTPSLSDIIVADGARLLSRLSVKCSLRRVLRRAQNPQFARLSTIILTLDGYRREP